MKIIIAGCGIVGAALAARLSAERHDVTVIDISEENQVYVSNSMDVLCITGDATNPEVLLEADIRNTDLFIAVTNTDRENILACLLARKMGANNTIARLRESDTAIMAEILKEGMSLSMIINPERDAAREIFNSLRYKPVGHVEYLAKGTTEIITCLVKPDAPICGVSLKDIHNIIGTKILVCGLKRDGQVFIPTA